jgi:hypothetical protein
MLQIKRIKILIRNISPPRRFIKLTNMLTFIFDTNPSYKQIYQKILRWKEVPHFSLQDIHLREE